MRKIVTKKELQHQVDLLNQITGNPVDMWITDDRGAYVRDENGKMQFHHGTFVLGWANGGVALERKGGSVTIVHRRSKREMMNAINLMLVGIAIGKEIKG